MTAANALSALWTGGLFGKAVIVTGGVALIGGGAYLLNQHLQRRDEQMIEYNAAIAEKNKNYTEYLLQYEKLRSQHPSAENQHKYSIAYANKLLVEEKWRELSDYATQQLQSQSNSYLYAAFRAKATAAQSNLSDAKADYETAIRLTPSDNPLFRLKLLAELSAVASHDNSVNQRLFTQLDEIEHKGNVEEKNIAIQQIKYTLLSTAQNEKQSAYSNFHYQQLSQILKYTPNDSDILCSLGGILANQVCDHQEMTTLDKQVQLQAAIGFFRSALASAKEAKQRYRSANQLVIHSINTNDYLSAEQNLTVMKNNQCKESASVDNLLHLEKMVQQSLQHSLQGIETHMTDVFSSIENEEINWYLSIDNTIAKKEAAAQTLLLNFEKNVAALEKTWPQMAISQLKQTLATRYLQFQTYIKQLPNDQKKQALEQAAISSAGHFARGVVHGFFDRSHANTNAYSASLRTDLNVLQHQQKSRLFL